MYRQRGFDEGVSLGLIVGKIAGEFLSRCAMYGPVVHQAVYDILCNLHELTPSVVAHVCDDILRILGDVQTNDDVDVGELRIALLALTSRSACAAVTVAKCEKDDCCCSK